MAMGTALQRYIFCAKQTVGGLNTDHRSEATRKLAEVATAQFDFAGRTATCTILKRKAPNSSMIMTKLPTSGLQRASPSLISAPMDRSQWTAK